jgi:hypothetical protein
MHALFFAVMAIVGLAVPSKEDLHWSDHYANAKHAAAQVQRPLLVVLEDPADPKGRFDQQQLASNASQLDLMKKFELCRMDVNTPYGKRVAEALKATQFPYLAITDKSTSYITFRGAGAMTADEWQHTLEAKQNGERPVAAATEATSGQRVEATKVITQWPVVMPPATTTQGGSYCPSCVRRQYYYQ